MESSASAGGMAIGIIVLYLAVLLFLVIIPIWRIFVKAGKPGWGSVVPIYNIVLMCQVCGKPGWWTVLCLIPCVNLIIAIILCIALAKSFGKGAGFAVGLILLSPVFLPILGYGKAAYAGQKPAAAKA
jgi:hypothetical protein